MRRKRVGLLAVAGLALFAMASGVSAQRLDNAAVALNVLAPGQSGDLRSRRTFGAGYATAEDRYVFMELLRGPARIAAVDVPGVDPFALATSGRQFVPSDATENFLKQEIDSLRAFGPKGRQVYADLVAYVDGINAYYSKHGLRPSARRSATHHPLFVAGPQVRDFYPEVLLELDLHGGGIDARGASFPGISMYVLLGRGKDFAWSATSANSDIVDQYVETLCGDDTHYLYNGECQAITTFDAGTLEATATEPLESSSSAKPCTDRDRVRDRGRTARRRLVKAPIPGRETFSIVAFEDPEHEPSPRSRELLPRDEPARVHVQLGLRRRQAHRTVFERPPPDPRAGRRERIADRRNRWFRVAGLRAAERTRPWCRSEVRVDRQLNNKSGLGFSASDNNWSFGPIQRALLLDRALVKWRIHTLATLVGAMNTAATQDLRAIEVLPTIVSAAGQAPPRSTHSSSS